MYKEEFYDQPYREYYNDDYSNLEIKPNESVHEKIFFTNYSPEFMTNDDFLENFMKIDHYNSSSSNSNFDVKKNVKCGDNKINDSISTHSSLNQNSVTASASASASVIASADQNISNDPSSASEKKNPHDLPSNHFTKHKKGRPMNDSFVIVDEVSKKIYDPNEDLVEYKKARKRVQNRESAVRTRQKKKDCNKLIGSENEYLKMENYRLFHENKNLKQEKSFLIEQIKFMQNLIRSNDIKIQNIDLEKNIPQSDFSSHQITLNGARQKPFGKLFNVFIICVLSIAYVSYDNVNEIYNNDSIIFSGDSTIKLNDSSERQNNEIKPSSYYFFYKLITVFGLVYLVYILLYYVMICIKYYLPWKREKLIKEM